MDEDDKSSHVGSPSPPFEGVITEEAEKQLESQGGDFDVANDMNGMAEEVNIWKILTNDFPTKLQKHEKLWEMITY